jgi:hypothetical protein
MARSKLTVKNLPLVWLRLTAFIADVVANPESSKPVVIAVGELLDNLQGQDAFGTENQLDPRGDQRD